MSGIFVIAFGSAFYPALIAAVLLLLPNAGAGRLLTAFLVGGLLTMITVGLIVVFGLGSTEALEGHNKHTVGPGVYMVLGTIAVALAAITARGGLHRGGADDHSLLGLRRPKKHSDKAHESFTKRALANGSIATAFAAGVLNTPSVLYLGALTNIIEGEYSVVTNIILVVAFNVIAFSFVEIPLVLYLVSPDRAQSLVGRIEKTVNAHRRTLASVVGAGLGLYLIAKGISGLG